MKDCAPFGPTPTGTPRHPLARRILRDPESIIQQAERAVRESIIVLVLGLLLTGCMTTRYTPFEPSALSAPESGSAAGSAFAAGSAADSASGSVQGTHVRITLRNRLQYVFEDATINSQTVSGIAVGHGFMSIPRADIKLIEKADGKRFDTHTALRLTGIVLTLTAIIAVSCAIEKDCTRQ